MAFKKMYTVYDNGNGSTVQFLHEIVEAPIETRDLSGYKIPHIQDYYELIFFTSGTRKIKAEEKEYSFSKGDIFVVAPGKRHSGYSEQCILDRYCLYLSPDVFANFPDSDGIMYVFTEFSENKQHKISLSPAQYEKMLHYMTNIDNSIKFGCELTKTAIAFAEIVKALSFLSCSVCSGNSETPKNKLLLDILSYIDSSIGIVNVPEIEKNFAVSRSSLWRLFKKEMNISPSDYIRKAKLEMSRIMLEKDMDVQQVSDLCGFGNCSHFIKTFKDEYGITPGFYKKGAV